MSIKHEVMSQFSTEANQLLVGGKPLNHIETLVGNTPFYAYDSSIISKSISHLKQTLPKEINIHYAIKANPYPAVVNFIKPLVSGFDVASRKEMLLAIQTGMPVKDISFAGPGKSNDDISAAIIAGITLHIESKNELDRAISLGKTIDIKPNIALRVNPSFELKQSGMKMSGGSKPFGIDEELITDILATIDFNLVNFRGFHIFSGSQNLNVNAIIEMHNKTFDLANKLLAMTPVDIDYVNIGGGLGIPYFPGDKRLDIQPISENLTRLIQHFASLKSTELIMELGRYIVGEAGVYVSKVVDKKTSRDIHYLVCDGGLHHHLANSGNFGQVIRKNYPVVIGNKLSEHEQELQTVNIVGPLCTPLDILASNVSLPRASIGDYVVVYQSGAYGATASPQEFLSQPQVYEILL